MRNPPQYWQGRIRQATTEDAVLAVVTEFLDSLPHDGIAKLPESSRPHGLRGREEVIAHNVQVARDELLCDGPAEVRELLRAMAIVLTEASSRLANLSLGPPSGL
ncbi:MAG: hypothetical protein ABIR98_07300 [Usitatibacter sp.]